MKKKRLIVVMMVAMMCGLSANNSLLVELAAGDEFNQICEDNSIDSELKRRAGCYENRTLPGVAVKILNFAIGVIGLSGVMAIIFAGQRMVTQGEDMGKVKQARLMIAYGVAGIIVAMVAFTVVNFVLQGLTK